MRVFNFAAGPATLPLEVLQQAQSEMTDWKSSGMSVMEVSHRSKAFIAVAQEAEADLRELLSIPANYKVLFLQGGATGMFSAIPMNLATADSTVDYVNTGAWSKKAIGEAKRYCKVSMFPPTRRPRTTRPCRRRARSSCRPTPRISTTRPTRPSAAWSSTTSPETSATCRWWRISPAPSCRVRWTCPSSA